MGKRTTRSGPVQPGRKDTAPAAWPPESHSGEGAASALETLQKLEKRRSASRPAEHKDDERPEDKLGKKRT